MYCVVHVSRFLATALPLCYLLQEDVKKMKCPSMMITLSHIILQGDQIGEDVARRSSEEDPRRCVQEEVRPEGADQGRPEIMISLIFLILFSIV